MARTKSEKVIKATPKIIEMRANNASLQEIVKKFDISISTVSLILRNAEQENSALAEVKDKRTGNRHKKALAEMLLKQGFDTVQTAEKLGVSKSIISIWNKNFFKIDLKAKRAKPKIRYFNGTPLHNRIIEVYNENTSASLRKIAKVVGVSYQTVHNHLKQAGVQFKQVN